eukprot:Rhum_TRINITY_DN14731_c3_g1::Rhum_TRINITY_DN14731_c3_g1_i1::g.115350::m.115350
MAKETRERSTVEHTGVRRVTALLHTRRRGRVGQGRVRTAKGEGKGTWRTCNGKGKAWAGGGVDRCGLSLLVGDAFLLYRVCVCVCVALKGEEGRVGAFVRLEGLEGGRKSDGGGVQRGHFLSCGTLVWRVGGGGVGYLMSERSIVYGWLYEGGKSVLGFCLFFSLYVCMYVGVFGLWKEGRRGGVGWKSWVVWVFLETRKFELGLFVAVFVSFFVPSFGVGIVFFSVLCGRLCGCVGVVNGGVLLLMHGAKIKCVHVGTERKVIHSPLHALLYFKLRKLRNKKTICLERVGERVCVCGAGNAWGK